MARVRDRADILPDLTEVFRTHGYEGASLSLISRKTGLGKGSLYNFFPGGKDEMAAAVLDGIDRWFRTHVFDALSEEADPRTSITAMFDATDIYFRSGERICIIGAFALSDARKIFASQINGYFSRWREALAAALRRCGHEAEISFDLAEEIVSGIQGALVAARALNDPALFGRRLGKMRSLAVGGCQ